MNTTHPGSAEHEIRGYLAAVDQAASALSPGARARLTGGLAERIAVALAERPGEVAAVLAECGDPYEVGATAVREAGPARQTSFWTRPGTVVGLFAASTVLGAVAQLAPGDTVHTVLRLPVLLLMFGGIAALSASRWWTRARKWTAVAWIFVPNCLVIAASALTGHTATTELSGLSPLGVMTFLVGEAIRVGLYGWLWIRRSEPAPEWAPSSFPRWAKVLVITVAVLFVAAEVSLWISDLETVDSLSGMRSGSLNP
ncbi:hypothetical protein AB0M42_10765 [Streptomyces sp. NPDC051784]|uniref:hypothetical protein n=1 Tax=Streptomyces sp. NPDC051784 TaxID=3155805 RepID=UPI0034395078